MIIASDLKKGVTFIFDGELYRVVDFRHTYLGRGSARVRVTIRNLETGTTIERVFFADDKFEEVRLELREVQYLYTDGHLYYFMDTETYEQPALGAEALGERVYYLKEGLTLHISIYEGRPVEVELPVTVDLGVIQTEPGIKGDTATGAVKKATLETGLVVQVPLFVEEGDIVRVDTRTGGYLTRLKG